MLNNQFSGANNVSMPLLMAYTKPSKIQEAANEEPVIYDPISQKIYDMRVVGTKSLKTSVTRKSGSASAASTDRKNEIDDQKQV